jgi:geranylgeranyl diphosphate synthase type I
MVPDQSQSYTPEAVRRCIEQLWSYNQDWLEYTRALRTSLRCLDLESPQPPFFLLLPGLCCQAAGGDPDRTIGVAAAWVLLYTAAHILDDLEDGETTCGASSAINVATGLIFTAIQSLAHSSHSDVTDQVLVGMTQDFACTILRMCGGQHADLVETPGSLENCWKIAEAKSGACFALACRAGARLAGAQDEVVEHYSQFGHHLGMMLQVCDDLEGIWSPAGGRSDLMAGKRTLPVVYALSVAPPTLQGQLLQCLQAAPRNSDAEAMARNLIEQTGAALYLGVEARCHYKQAQAALYAANPRESPRDQLVALLSKVLSPLAMDGKEAAPWPG